VRSYANSIAPAATAPSCKAIRPRLWTAHHSRRAGWTAGHTLDDLFYIVRTQMPYNAPASRSKQQYVDVLAFVLKANGFAGGGQSCRHNPRRCAR
jgi:hypothetical protein